ncbi:Tyrosinase [Colletotrichum higginsianum IMI 349063]|uniref:tyrosinase n=2 Tax=Colletotrichum higginsianum (strain IMI 349063) TaxID=759273 RepID=A0A1B7Y8K3_COLHI|nr:Tyrosinase [Colletotrichum higginsianum IMI 349063]OBR08255.1 Tyrosinase [Colletotrichum higginsianum IMI 349063]
MSVDAKALKAAQAKGLTVGVIPKSGDKPLRLEIDDFLQDVELANLYFLALEAFMSKKVSQDPFSYYEICGIHGQPWRAWDGVTSADFGPSPGSVDPRSGYCSHGSVVFPTWHRQALYLHAADIASKLKAQAALDRFRIPYFDPFLPRQKLISGDVFTYGLPIIFTLPQIQVRRPENPSRWVPMANPLYQFNFPPDSKGGFDWSMYDRIPAARDHTIRGLNAASQSANHNYVMRAFDNAYNPVSGLSSQAPQSIWHVMFDRQTWTQMSNNWDPRTRDPASAVYNANSLEGFHDDIHTQIATGPRGSSGHMGSPAFAGFDPSFWLHHCNVDRLLAIWQGIHSRDPESIAWWTSLEVPEGNFVEPGRLAETPRTPLVPFRKGLTAASKPIWWTSNDCRNHLDLGYDYPQTAAARRSGDVVRSLTAWANAQLGWLAPRSPRPADENARTQLKRQITQPMPFFPSKVLIDGTTPLSSGQAFIGSMAAPMTAKISAANTTVSVSRRLATRAKAAIKDLSLGRKQKVRADGTTGPGSSRKLTPQQLSQLVLSTALPSKHLDFNNCYGHLGDVISHHKMTQWNVTFSVDKFSLDGSFVIFFFLGDFSPEVATWTTDPHLAGSSGIFASSRAAIDSGACENCSKQEASGLKYMDTVALTPALLTYWDNQEEHYGCRVGDLSPGYVLPFLVRNLHWRVVNIHGDQVPRETIPSLKVMVYSETVTLPHDIAETPQFEGQSVHYEVTNGRPGGISTGDDM